MVRNIARLKSLLDKSGLRFSPLIDGLGITIEDINMDIISSASGNPVLNELIMQSPRMQKIAGVNFQVINPELLFIMKMELAREKDTNEAMVLLQSGVLRKAPFLEFLTSLGKSMSDPDSLRVYSLMMSD